MPYDPTQDPNNPNNTLANLPTNPPPTVVPNAQYRPGIGRQIAGTALGMAANGNPAIAALARRIGGQPTAPNAPTIPPRPVNPQMPPPQNGGMPMPAPSPGPLPGGAAGSPGGLNGGGGQTPQGGQMPPAGPISGGPPFQPISIPTGQQPNPGAQGAQLSPQQKQQLLAQLSPYDPNAPKIPTGGANPYDLS